jgi:hypothetical protein
VTACQQPGSPYRRGAGWQYWTASPPLGVILGAVEPTGCHLDAECSNVVEARVRYCSRWAQRDQFHWRVADPKPFREPVNCDGALGLWTVTGAVADAVRLQMGPVA